MQLKAILSICLSWLLISLAPICKYLSHSGAIAATLLGLLSIAFGVYGLARLNRRKGQIGLVWFMLLFFTFTAAFTVLYPLSLKHTINRGSDREDAIRIELVAIRHHQSPSTARTFLGNAPTPLPGALLLATPFFAIGHIAWQNFLWLALFFYFTICFFQYRATALVFLIVFLLFVPSNLSDFIAGGDYLTNFFYVAIAAGLFRRSLNLSLKANVAAAVVLGVALSSRSIYLFLLIPLLALTLQRTQRSRTALLFGVVVATVGIVTLSVFVPYHLADLVQQLTQNQGKLRYIPKVLHPQWTLPLLGLVVVCRAFFVRMDFPKLFLLFGISSFVMLAPPIVTVALHSRTLPFEFSYFAISVLSVALWTLRKYERVFLIGQTSPAQV